MARRAHRDGHIAPTALVGLLQKKARGLVAGTSADVKIMFSGTLNIRCRIKIGIRKGTIILTTTHLLNRNPKPYTVNPPTE